MAFKMTPGRSPLQQTGRGIPSAFLQTKTTTTVNPVSGNTTKEQAAAEAKKKAEEKLAESIKNKPLGGTEKRSEEGSASYTTPGKIVERQLDPKDKKAVEAWKNAPQKNKDKYKDVVTEVKETASGQGKIETKEPDYGSWYHTTVDQNFGGGSGTGMTTSQSYLDAGERQNRYDTSRGNQIAPGSNPAGNIFEHKKITEQENRMQNSGFGTTSNPYSDRWSDYGAYRGSDRPDSRIDTSPGSGEKRRLAYIETSLTKVDKKAAEDKVRKDAVKAKDAAKLEEINKRKAAAEADRAAKKAAVAAKTTPLNQKVAMVTKNSKKAHAKQKASMAAKSYKTPAKMKKC